MKKTLLATSILLSALFVSAQSLSLTKINSDTRLHFIRIQFLKGSSIGYACGTSGLVMKTTDDGNSWKDVSAPTTTDFYAMCFIHPDTGYVGGNDGRLYKTVDGGASWSNTVIISNEYIRAISIVNNQGYIGIRNSLQGGGYGTLFKTNDRGNTWATERSFIRQIYSINIFSDTNLIISGYDLLEEYASPTWTPYQGETFNTFSFFFNNKKGFLYGGDGFLFSVNGSLSSKTQIDLKTTDYLNDMKFNKNIGFMSGGNISKNKSSIFQTLDSGATWMNVELGGYSRLTGIDFNSKGNAVFVGLDGTILLEKKLVTDITPETKTDFITVLKSNLLIYSGLVNFTQFKLYNTEGKLIQEGVIDSSNQIQLAKRLRDGVYIIQLNNSSESYSQRVFLD